MHLTFPDGELLEGDNVALLNRLPMSTVDLVLTSPPYDDLRAYGGGAWDFDAVARELVRVMKSGATLVWIVGDRTKDGNESGSSFRQALAFQALGLRLLDTMIYVKSGSGAAGSNRAYWQLFEYMFVFTKGPGACFNPVCDVPNKFAGEVTKGGRVNRNNELKDRKSRTIQEYSKRGNVWKYAVGNNNGDDNENHPAPFPEHLAFDHIVSWSNPGDLVLDPFSGSGTVAKMAAKLSRRFIGMELEPSYNAIAQRRLARVYASMELF